jgi:hypothetical protein
MDNVRIMSQEAINMPLGRYRHFKGGLYEVLGVALSSDDGVTELVIYRSEKDGQLWSRPLPEFAETISRDGYEGQRFTYLE